MKPLQFKSVIQAPRSKVWSALWDDENYRKWTSVFSEGSCAKSDWKEGSRILFVDGNGSGMYSEIARLVPEEFMSFRHIGMVKEYQEQPLDAESEKWSGATENYTLEENEGVTTLTVEMDITDDFAEYFENAFPKALEKVKEIAEG